MKGRRDRVCKDCALTVSGVRGNGKPEVRGDRRTVKARRKAYASDAEPEDFFQFFDAHLPAEALTAELPPPPASKSERERSAAQVDQSPSDEGTGIKRFLGRLKSTEPETDDSEFVAIDEMLGDEASDGDQGAGKDADAVSQLADIRRRRRAASMMGPSSDDDAEGRAASGPAVEQGAESDPDPGPPDLPIEGPIGIPSTLLHGFGDDHTDDAATSTEAGRTQPGSTDPLDDHHGAVPDGQRHADSEPGDRLHHLEERRRTLQPIGEDVEPPPADHQRPPNDLNPGDEPELRPIGQFEQMPDVSPRLRDLVASPDPDPSTGPAENPFLKRSRVVSEPAAAPDFSTDPFSTPGRPEPTAPTSQQPSQLEVPAPVSRPSPPAQPTSPTEPVALTPPQPEPQPEPQPVAFTPPQPEPQPEPQPVALTPPLPEPQPVALTPPLPEPEPSTAIDDTVGLATSSSAEPSSAIDAETGEYVEVESGPDRATPGPGSHRTALFSGADTHPLAAFAEADRHPLAAFAPSTEAAPSQSTPEVLEADEVEPELPPIDDVFPPDPETDLPKVPDQSQSFADIPSIDDLLPPEMVPDEEPSTIDSAEPGETTMLPPLLEPIDHGSGPEHSTESEPSQPDDAWEPWEPPEPEPTQPTDAWEPPPEPEPEPTQPTDGWEPWEPPPEPEPEPTQPTDAWEPWEPSESDEFVPVGALNGEPIDSPPPGSTVLPTVDDESAEWTVVDDVPDLDGSTPKQRADTDARGSWIPPALRGIAPDAHEAGQNLPRRRR